MRSWRVVGLSLVTLGLLIAGYVVYQYYAPSQTDQNNSQAADSLLHVWARKAPESDQGESTNYKDGQVFAVLKIPAISVSTRIAEGTSNATLAKGVGHYPESQGPGQIGNFALAAHRCCRKSGQPFKFTYKLRTGDDIIVETKTHIYTYKVINYPCSGSGVYGGHLYVTPNRIDAINPTPCSTIPNTTRKFITLTTCHPDRSIVDLTNRPAPYRLIVFGELTKIEHR